MTLLEKLVATLIVSIISTAVVMSFPTLSQWQTISQNSIDQSFKVVAIHTLFDEIISSLDNFRITPTPLIHRNGEIRYTDGSISSLSARTDRNGTHRESDALSVLEFESTALVRIIDESGSLTCCLCPLERDVHGVGYTGDKLFEIFLHRLSILNSEGCAPIEIQVFSRSLFFEQPEGRAQERVRLFIPIKRLYTLYVSKDKTLRYVQQRGGEIRENQPLLNKTPLIKLIASTENSGDLKLSLLTDGKSIFSKNYSRILSPLSPHTVLLHHWRSR